MQSVYSTAILGNLEIGLFDYSTILIKEPSLFIDYFLLQYLNATLFDD